MAQEGMLRLARVVSASIKMQKLTLRDIEDITKQHYGIALNKNTIRTYAGGTVKRPQEFALQKLAPLLFKVKGFTNDDDIGYPDFEKFGVIPFKRTPDNAFVGEPVIKSSQIIDDIKHEKLLLSTKLDEMPLKELRYQDYRDIQKRIIENVQESVAEVEPETDPVKKLFELYPELVKK